MLAENYISALRNWEESPKATTTESDKVQIAKEIPQSLVQSKISEKQRQPKEETRVSKAIQHEMRETELQIQQVLQPEPVDMQNQLILSRRRQRHPTG